MMTRPWSSQPWSGSTRIISKFDFSPFIAVIFRYNRRRGWELNSAFDRIAIILAAGQGKRMKSDIPKVLHKVSGRYIVDYVIDEAREAGLDRQILVIGHKAEMVEEALAGRKVEFAHQARQLGTGHAIMM